MNLLWDSIQKHNKNNIPFYLSVPKKDLIEFRKIISNPEGIIWITDEQIVKSNKLSSLDSYYQWDGRLSQQVIKAEFWRIFGDDKIAYLCLDSESTFIKDFYLNDFLSSDGNTYTVIHQNKELLQIAANKNINRVLTNFNHVCEMLKQVFRRVGPNYDFGPTPVIWSSEVWRALEANYLKPNQITIWDAIKLYPSELQLYGEALLKFRPIPLLPLEPIFKVYHYDWQYYFYRKTNETPAKLTKNYLGYLRQSNWDYDSDYGAHALRKSFGSRVLRKIKRFFARYR